MIGRIIGGIFACWLAANAQQHVLLDFSGSMKGFAIVPNARLTGMLQRLGHALEVSGAVAVHGFNTSGGRRICSDLPLNDAAGRFTKPDSYSGNSPLIWSIGEAARRPRAAEILVFTDGMEDDARLEVVANAFAQFAHDGWSLGIASFMLPFEGNYFAEMAIPLSEFFPKIMGSVREANQTWAVRDNGCRTANGSCYAFKGQRPLLVILLSRTASLARLFAAVDDAASQVDLKPQGKLQVFPASDYTPRIRAELKADARQSLRPPRSFEVVNGTVKADFSCLEARRDPLTVALLLSSSPTAIEEPTIARPDGVRLLGNAPAWASRPSSSITFEQDGSARHEVPVVCKSAGLLDSIRSSSSVLPGVFRAEYTYKRAARTQGWWIDLSAENPWQFPHKVYRLRELVNRVQELALQKQTPRTFTLEMSLKAAN